MKALKIGGIIIFILIVIAMIIPSSGVVDQVVDSEMQHVENKVAEDAVAQYEIAKRQGDKIAIYTHAGLVAAAYLQAKDEDNYKTWKAIEKQSGKEAGMPDQP